VRSERGIGRRFLLEVYAPAAQGQGSAPVQSVELHVLVVPTFAGLSN
jgi:hypothetical protein